MVKQLQQMISQSKSSPNYKISPKNKKKRWQPLLFIPFVIYVLLVSLFLGQDINREAAFREAAVKDTSFGKYLYQEINITRLLSSPQRAFHYYYQLAQTSANNEPVIIIRYPMAEKEVVQARLQKLPKTFRGRTDVVVGEAHEFLQKFLIRPYENEHQLSLSKIEYFSFNLGEGKTAHALRMYLISGIGILLFFLPFYYSYFWNHSSRVSDGQTTIS